MKHRNVRRREARRWLLRTAEREKHLLPKELHTAGIMAQYDWVWEHYLSQGRDAALEPVPDSVVRWTNPHRNKFTAQRIREWQEEGEKS